MTNNSIYRDFLSRVGLTDDQATVYEVILKQGILPARKISQLSNLKRGLAYKVIDQLQELQLIEKIDKKVALFVAKHPQTVMDMLEKKKESIAAAEKSLGAIIGNMVSDYNLHSGRPNVRFYEGISGLETLYEDILLENKPIKLIRSPLDDSRPELASLVSKQLKKQIELGITTRAITPHVADSQRTMKLEDSERKVSRVLLPKEQLSIPAQVIVYGDKVALTSYGEFMVTTIIHNPDIKQTFDALFEILWHAGQIYTERMFQQ